MRAIRESATGGTPLPDIAMCLLLGGIYVAIGVVVTETVLRAAPPEREPVSDMTVPLRIFFIGGLTAYRGLINWLSPWIFLPTLVVAPIFQILLFVYIGRTAGVQSDEFYVIGNAVQYASIPCLFAMTHAIAGERSQQTLSYILVSPAGRLPLFLGRALPVIANAMFVAAFSLLVSGLILGIDVPVSTWPAIALVIFIATFSCTGLGLICAGVGLRVRETAVLNNVIFGLLLTSPAPTSRSTSSPAGCRRSRSACR
jgi:ABC-2 type transport system permease protein